MVQLLWNNFPPREQKVGRAEGRAGPGKSNQQHGAFTQGKAMAMGFHKVRAPRQKNRRLREFCRGSQSSIKSTKQRAKPNHANHFQVNPDPTQGLLLSSSQHSKIVGFPASQGTVAVNTPLQDYRIVPGNMPTKLESWNLPQPASNFFLGGRPTFY